ncbi:MAG: amino acid adenylation domain-containing protein [Opitutaceae bacterium]
MAPHPKTPSRPTLAQDAFRSPPADQRQRPAPANAAEAPPPEGFLFSGFLQQLDRRRGAPAVITSDRMVSYGELYRHACALAHELHVLGVNSNELVAILMPKGWEQVAAAIGIQLAGAAYLPIEVDLPPERIRFLLQHGEARAIITTASHRRSGEVPTDHRVIEIDRLEPGAAGDRTPKVRLCADDLAYLIFTSGSTGTPKGVMIDHRGAWNTIVDINNRFGVTHSDRVLVLSRLSFDLSVYDIFGLLAAGGAIVMPDADRANDPAHWAELCRHHEVTIWNSVPALMQLFAEFVSGRRETGVSRLRLALMSGDWIPLSLPEQVRRMMPRGEIVSLGGATEASIWSILHPIRKVDPSWKSIPYGRAMANQSFHVLHADLSPCTESGIGELYIGGIGLARGYWKDPEKTAASFITHPGTGARLYRTGDLGRYLPGGEIEFLGRADLQVKIQGYRIELGEIEARIAAHPGVRRSVVVAKGDNDNGRRLIAYLVADASFSSNEETEARLRLFLQESLPDYMIPAAFVFLLELPLTANGKVDVKALPDPSWPAFAEGGAAGTDPETETEEILLGLWKDVLPAISFGIHEEFAALGGNSLIGTRLILRVREAFEIDAPVRFIFDHPTVARMAAAVEELLLDEIDNLDEPESDQQNSA